MLVGDREPWHHRQKKILQRYLSGIKAHVLNDYNANVPFGVIDPLLHFSPSLASYFILIAHFHFEICLCVLNFEQNFYIIISGI